MRWEVLETETHGDPSSLRWGLLVIDRLGHDVRIAVADAFKSYAAGQLICNMHNESIQSHTGIMKEQGKIVSSEGAEDTDSGMP